MKNSKNVLFFYLINRQNNRCSIEICGTVVLEMFVFIELYIKKPLCESMWHVSDLKQR